MTRPGTAILCSGQGGQARDMFRLVADAPEATPVFARAASLLGGTDPRALIRSAPIEALFGNRTGQILCCTAALAARAALAPHWPAMVVIAGYSIGELAAWGCAGLLDSDTTLTLAAARADAMDAAAPPGAGLLAVTGLDRPTLRALLAAPDAALAIDNGASGAVVGGTAATLDRFAAAARGAGAQGVTRLPVAVPSHTPLLAAARDQFADRLRAVAVGAPADGVRLLRGIDAVAVRGPDDRDALADQLVRTIDWAGCLDACVEAGATRALELGPGEALARMAERVGLEARALAQFRTLAGVGAWLGRE